MKSLPLVNNGAGGGGTMMGDMAPISVRFGEKISHAQMTEAVEV